MFFLLFKIIDFFINYFILKKFEKTYLWTSSCPYLITFSGNIRKGKTTLMVGISQLLTFVIKEKLSERLEFLKIKLYKINLDIVEKEFIKILEENNFNYFESIDIIIKRFKGLDQITNYYFKVPESFYEEKDFTNLEHIFNMSYFLEYLYTFYHLQRQNHVFSNIKYFNHLTKSYASFLDPKEQDIKSGYDCDFKKSFDLLEHSIFLKDEALLDKSNIHHQKMAKEDLGSDVFFRLFGQVFRETSYYLTTLQNTTRLLKTERELFQTHVLVKENKVIYFSPLIRIYLIFFEKLVTIFHKFFSLFLTKAFREKRTKIKTFYKRLLFFFQKKQEQIFSKSFIDYKTAVYQNVEDIGKLVEFQPGSKENYYFTFRVPIVYAFGNVDTHEYHSLYVWLIEHSKGVISQKIEEEIFDEILLGSVEDIGF